MKLQKLFENEKDFFDGLTDDQIAEYLAKNCKEFLKKNPGKYLFRGIKEALHGFAEKTTYANRKPRDSSPLFASHISSYFKKTFGIDYRTEHALFCSQSRSVGQMYGKYVYVVLPTGNFSLCYSSSVVDLYTLVTNPAPWTHFSKFTNKLETMLTLDKYELVDAEKMQLIRYFIGAISANPKLNTESGDEAKVAKYLNSVNNYLRISINFTEEQANKILTVFKDTIENKTEEYVYAFLSATDFKEDEEIGDVKEENEIMLHCKKYVSLPVKTNDEFNRAIGIVAKAQKLI